MRSGVARSLATAAARSSTEPKMLPIKSSLSVVAAASRIESDIVRSRSYRIGETSASKAILSKASGKTRLAAARQTDQALSREAYETESEDSVNLDALLSSLPCAHGSNRSASSVSVAPERRRRPFQHRGSRLQHVAARLGHHDRAAASAQTAETPRRYASAPVAPTSSYAFAKRASEGLAVAVAVRKLGPSVPVDVRAHVRSSHDGGRLRVRRRAERRRVVGRHARRKPRRRLA